MRRFIFILFIVCMMNGCSEKKLMNTGQGLIVLLTDFGLQDSYVGEMKGVILSAAPEARLVDLTHDIEAFNVKRGAVVLSGASSMFPTKTIFLGVVDPGVGGSRNPILLLTQQGKYYVGPDNGLFSIVAEREGIERIWILDKVKYYRNGIPASTFHGRDIFAPVAAALARGEDPSLMGTPQKKLEPLSMQQAKIVGSSISGEVLYVDRYGNVVTNIPATFATPLKMGALVKISLSGSNFSAPYVETYSKVATGRALLLKNSQGLLEISVNQGSASRMYNIKAGSSITIQP
jgi:S-adenosylmethionine hydrolase